jgi:hypothetical protein
MANQDNIDVISTVLWSATQNGNGYIAASTVQSLTLVNTHLRAVITNPSTSTRSICLSKATGWNNQGAAKARLIANPTSVPANAMQMVNLLMGSPKTTQATCKYDVSSSPLSGGTDLGIDLVFNTTPVSYDDPWTIPPGQALGIDCQIIAAIAASATLDLRFYEF